MQAPISTSRHRPRRRTQWSGLGRTGTSGYTRLPEPAPNAGVRVPVRRRWHSVAWVEASTRDYVVGSSLRTVGVWCRILQSRVFRSLSAAFLTPMTHEGRATLAHLPPVTALVSTPACVPP